MSRYHSDRLIDAGAFSRRVAEDDMVNILRQARKRNRGFGPLVPQVNWSGIILALMSAGLVFGVLSSAASLFTSLATSL